MSIEENTNASINGDPYANFRALLQQSVKFPTTYTFKFIIKTDDNKSKELKAIFEDKEAHITSTHSSGGKYKSYTVKVQVKDEEEVINYYKEVSKIDTVIML